MISDYLFQVNVKEKVSRANFIAILTGGTTDAAITEQELMYLIHLDPDNFVPRLLFFTVSELHQGRDAAMLKSAIINAFTENNMEDALTKIVFFGSDGTWTNIGLKSGLITWLKEYFEWIVFVWCLSHRLELAMMDSLKTFMSPVDDSLRHLYYMYKNSSKKLSQLKTLFKSLTEIYEYETKAIKPEKSTGTRWLDHKIKGMEKLTDKFRVYAAQIKNSIDARNCTAADRAVLQGKLNALTQASVILRSALLTDILEPAKKLSLISQKESGDIISMVNALKRTRDKYGRWQTKFAENPEEVFQLPTLKRVLNQMDTENNTHQGIKLLYSEREKQYIQDYTVSILENVIKCLDTRFGKLDECSDNVTAEVKEGDAILLHICRVLNTKVLPTQINMDSLSMQVESLTFLYEHFKKMSLFEGGSDLAQIIDGYFDIVTYVTAYFPVQTMDPTELWKNVFQLKKHDNDKEDWSLTLLIVEICLCAPYSNAALERFFSLLKYV